MTKKTQLNKNAVPSIGISPNPLPDEMLVDFPLHIAKTKVTDGCQLASKGKVKRKQYMVLSAPVAIDHDYCISNQPKSLNCSASAYKSPLKCLYSRNLKLAVRRNAKAGQNVKACQNAKARQIVRDSPTGENTESPPEALDSAKAPESSEGTHSPIAPESFEETHSPIAPESSEETHSSIAPESPKAPEAEKFSWQENSAIVCDADTEMTEEIVDCQEYCLYEETAGKRDALGTDSGVDPAGEPPPQILCNFCGHSIIGFRYICVQCADYDLCATCECAGEHHAHYMLRVPGPRPHAEVNLVLERVRRGLAGGELTYVSSGLGAGDVFDSVKVEVKAEPESDPLMDKCAPDDQQFYEFKEHEVEMPRPLRIDSDVATDDIESDVFKPQVLPERSCSRVSVVKQRQRAIAPADAPSVTMESRRAVDRRATVMIRRLTRADVMPHIHGATSPSIRPPPQERHVLAGLTVRSQDYRNKRIKRVQ